MRGVPLGNAGYFCTPAGKIRPVRCNTRLFKGAFMIYFDNAATGGFKTRAAISAAESVIKFLSANPGRSGHRLALTGAKIVADCREILAREFGADPSRVIFTKNCTEALNTAVFGGIKGGKVFTTTLEHNSVLRPLYKLQRQGIITLEILPPDDIMTAIKKKYDGTATAIVATAVSNVTGETLPVYEIGEFAKEKNLLFIVDGAQGGGHIPLSVKEQNISCLALAGHKGLGGIMGSGVLILDDGVELEPLTYGGTGTETFLTEMPPAPPERFEAGTLNLPAVASLLEGVRHIAKNFPESAKTLTRYSERLILGLSEIPSVKIFSKPNPAGIVSFGIKDRSSEEVADALNAEYDVAIRGGYHCAPLCHEYLGTQKQGLARASLAVNNSAAEIDYFIRAIKKIATKSF